MTKSIVSIFSRRDDADKAAQAIVRQGISAERIGLLYGGEYDTTEQSEEVHADEAVASVAAAGGAALAGLIAFAVPAVGTVLTTGAVVAALGAKMDAEANDPNTHLRHVLQTMGLMDEQTEVYAQRMRQGYTLLAVNAEDDESDAVADILRREGGESLDLRRREV